MRGAAWLMLACVTLTACSLLGDSRPTRVYTPDLIGPIDDIRNVPGDPSAHEAVVPKGDGLILPPPDPDTGRYPSSPGNAYCIEDDGTVSATDLP